MALAHTKVISSVPMAGSVQKAVLSQIDIKFDEPFVLALIKLTENSTGFNKIYRNKNPDHMTDHQVSIEPLPTGQFVLEWRGLAEDGHVISGMFEFSVTN